MSRPINIVIPLLGNHHADLDKCLMSLSEQTYQEYRVHISCPIDITKNVLRTLSKLSENKHFDQDKIFVQLLTGRKMTITKPNIYNKAIKEVAKDEWLIICEDDSIFSDNSSLMKISEHTEDRHNLITWNEEKEDPGFCFNASDLSKRLFADNDSIRTVYNKLTESGYFKKIHSLKNITNKLEGNNKIPVSPDDCIISPICKNTMIENINSENNFFNTHLSDSSEIPIYYVNLDRSPDRNIYSLNQFEDLNNKLVNKKINATRIAAIDGKNTDSMYNLFTSNNILLDGLSSGEIGCTLSHLTAIKTAYDNNDKFAIIMEDDVNLRFFHENYDFFLKKTQMLSSDIEIIQLLPYKEPNAGSPLYDEEPGFYEWKIVYYCSGMYLITRKGMEKIVKLCCEKEKFKVNNINCYIADLFIYSTCKSVTSNIPLGLLTITKSTIRERDDTDLLKSDIVKCFKMSKKISSLN